MSDRAHGLGSDGSQVDVGGAGLVAVDLLEREHVGVDRADGLGERVDVHPRPLGMAAAEDVEGRDAHDQGATIDRSAADRAR